MENGNRFQTPNKSLCRPSVYQNMFNTDTNASFHETETTVSADYTNQVGVSGGFFADSFAQALLCQTIGTEDLSVR